MVTHRISSVLLFLLTYAAAVWNPSALHILHIIETISAPLIAVILFILPMYAVRAVPAMCRYRAWSNIFVLVMGLIALSALIYGLGCVP